MAAFLFHVLEGGEGEIEEHKLAVFIQFSHLEVLSDELNSLRQILSMFGCLVGKVFMNSQTNLGKGALFLMLTTKIKYLCL